MRLRMWLQCLAIGVVVGVVLGVVWSAVGGVLGFGLAAVGTCVLAPLAGRAWAKRTFPARVLEVLDGSLDGDFRPPAAAQPTEVDVVDRLFRAENARDWADLDALLDPDFAYVDLLGVRRSRRVYTRTARWMVDAFPDVRATVDEVLADPTDPHVAWVRHTDVGHPRRGRALDVTGWSRWTLNADRTHVRELATVGVVRVG